MKGVFMDKSVQLIRFKITPSNDVLLADSHQIIKKALKRTFFKDIKRKLEHKS